MSGFLEHLTPEALRELRLIVRRIHFRHFPHEHQTDYEVDRFIDTLGPEIAEKLIMRGKGSGLIPRRVIRT